MTSEIPKKRIVLLCDCLADFAGGAEKQIYELAKRLDKSKYDVFVVSMDSWGTTSPELIEATGSKLLIFKVVRIYGISGILQGFRFLKFLKNNKIDILLTYHFGSDIWGAFWGRLANVRTIISNRRDMGFWRNDLHVLAYKCINRWVNKIIVVSSSIKDMIIQKEGYPSGKIEVVFNGVELTKQPVKDLSSIRRSLDIKETEIVIVHVANLKPVKGHKYLLEAFASLCHQHPDLKLLLVGRDDLNGELQSMARRFGVLGKTLFLGQRKDVADLLAIADICVLPSLSEGMSNAVLEYMSAGKPVIATKVGGNPELIQDGFNGLLVEKENYKQLESALQILINDPDKRTRMGSNGQARVQQEFSLPTMIERYETVFHEIKVLHLISSGGFYGAEKVILTLSKHSDSVLHIIGALNNLHNPHLELIEKAKDFGIPVATFESKGRLDFTTIKKIQNFLYVNGVDILHTHNFKANFIGFSLKFFQNTKWIVTVHGWTGTDLKLRFFEALDKILINSANRIVCVSDTTLRFLLDSRVNPKKLITIHNGININELSYTNNNPLTRKEFGLATDEIVLIIIGRLSPEKGHAILLHALSKITKEFKKIKCLIVGDGPLKEELKELSMNLNINEHVIFTGFFNDIPKIYSIAHIFVNTSYTEGLPMTLLEAMATKVCVIATAVGAVPTVIQNDVNGLLINSPNIEDLRMAIISIISNQDLRKKLVEQAYSDVTKNFGDDIMFSKYKQLYANIALKK